MKASTIWTNKKIITVPLVIIFWIGVWYIAALLIGQELLVPTPAVTLETLFRLGATGQFWLNVLFSTLRIIYGFALGVLIGVLGGYLSAKSKLVHTLFSPILHLARAVPVVSFILLAFVWIKTNFISVFITVLMVAPIIWETVRAALVGIDRGLVEMGQVFGLSNKDILLKIKFPQIFPPFMASLTSALGLAWKAGIAAEYICHPKQSVGVMLYNAKTYLETAETFALTLVVVVISFGLELLVKYAARRCQG